MYKLRTGTLQVLLLSMFASANAQGNYCGWMENRPISFLRLNGTYHSTHVLPHLVTDADSLFTLPVVVHVIHTGTAIGSPDNPTDAQIMGMINGLNKAFRKNGPSFGGPDIKLQFQLAIRSPQCGITNGINRVNGSIVPNYSSGGITNNGTPGSANEFSIKSLSRWPNTDYINIWIVNKINGSSTSPGGYTYFPEFNNAQTDGLVLQASVVDSLNKTIVHEMGHYFYLYHTFHDDSGYETACATDTACTNNGDLICDTEPVLLQTSCSVTTNTCTGNPYVVVDVSHNYTVLNNYMGYTNCQWMFTNQQKTRMRWAFFAFRQSLVTSGALAPSSGLSPAIACIPAATYGLSMYYGLQQLDFNTFHVYSNTSNADNAFYLDHTCNQSTSVIKGQVYPLTVTGSYLNPHRFKVYIDYNNNGDFNDPGEMILSDWTGIATANVTIPLSGVKTNILLRMRVVADNPALPEPTYCQLHGTLPEGAGQVEDFSVIILKRQIFSISSGQWNIASNWSCNCIPQGDDQVTVNAGHTITITPAMGNLQCGGLIINPGGVCNVSGNLFKIVVSN